MAWLLLKQCFHQVFRIQLALTGKHELSDSGGGPIWRPTMLSEVLWLTVAKLRKKQKHSGSKLLLRLQPLIFPFFIRALLVSNRSGL